MRRLLGMGFGLALCLTAIAPVAARPYRPPAEEVVVLASPTGTVDQFDREIPNGWGFSDIGDVEWQDDTNIAANTFVTAGAGHFDISPNGGAGNDPSEWLDLDGALAVPVEVVFRIRVDEDPLVDSNGATPLYGIVQITETVPDEPYPCCGDIETAVEFSQGQSRFGEDPNSLDFTAFDGRVDGSEFYETQAGTLEDFNQNWFWLRVRVDDLGTSARFWLDGTDEPADWQAYEIDPVHWADADFRYLGIDFANSGHDIDVAIDSVEFVDGLTPVPPDCGSEAFVDIAPPAEADIPVTVRYDPRFIVPLDRQEFADDVAAAVQGRAEYALTQYQALGFPVPEELTVEIRCDIGVSALNIDELIFGIDILPTEPDGFTESSELVKLRASTVRRFFQDAVQARSLPAQWPAGVDWANLVDHEMAHTAYHVHHPNSLDVGLNYGARGTVIEGSAVAMQDLVNAAVDDLQAAAAQSYLDAVSPFLAPQNPNQEMPPALFDPASFYRMGAGFQYWGERFGEDPDEADLEDRVAAFLDDLIAADGSSHQAVSTALGDQDIRVALRDLYVAGFALEADNVTPTQNRRFQILDRNVTHGDPAGLQGGSDQNAGTPYPRLVRAQADLVDPLSVAVALGAYQGKFYDIELTGSPAIVRVGVAADFTGPHDPRLPDTGRVVLAFVPVDADGKVTLNDNLMPFGPDPGSSEQPYFVDVADSDRLGVLVLSTHFGADSVLNVEGVAGLPTVDIVAPTTADPIAPDYQQPLAVQLEIQPRYGTQLVPQLAADDITVEIGGRAADVDPPVPDGSSWLITARVPSGWTPGANDLTVTFDSEDDTELGAIVLPNPIPLPGGPPTPSQSPASGSLGTLGEDDSASTTATISPETRAASFSIAWAGSDFDLELQAPSGRMIGETTIATDVQVSQTSNTVSIRITDPEPGIWDVSATGIDVPAPEPVTYEVLEYHTPLLARLSIAASGTAGLPIQATFGWSTTGGGVPDAQIVASVTDPGGTTRHFPLFDTGGAGDNQPGDGVYGALLWATDLPGTYSVRIDATGQDADGNPLARVATDSAALGPKVDTDADGVADAAEPDLGLDQAVATDGASDADRDGATMATEIAAGTDPFSWDTDGGGEADSSETQADRDPRLAEDDAALGAPEIAAIPRDDFKIEIHARTAEGVGSVDVYRATASGITLIGSIAGSGATLIDDGLEPGAYAYLGVAVAPSGAESAPLYTRLVTAREDATRPMAALWLNNGAYSTNATNIGIRFLDVTEPVADMRFGSSMAELAEANWQPFSASVRIEIGAPDGAHLVFAQLRDQSGLESPAMVSRIDLDSQAPTSSADPLPLVTIGPSVEVTYDSADERSGMASVDLWVRYRFTELQPWGDWELADSSATSPFFYQFAYGDGLYEFHTVGIDGAGNRESPRATADAATRALLTSGP